MKILTKTSLTVLAYALAGAFASAGELARYPFTSNSVASIDTSPGSVAGNVTAGPGYNVAGSVFFNNGRLAVASAAVNSSSAATNLAAGDYFEFTVTADPGKVLNVDALSLVTARASGSPDRVSVYTSADNYAKPVLSDAVVAGTYLVDLFSGPYQSRNAITFRVIAHGSHTGRSGTTRFQAYDDIVVMGTSVDQSTVSTGNWSNPATWGGRVPTAGQNVYIPAGRTVILDTHTPALGNVEVVGTLRFDTTKDLNLTSSHLVIHGGRLEIGSVTTPYDKKATITLTGSDPSANLVFHGHNTGSKGLVAVRGGVVEIHGHRASALSWTKLNANASPGATSITVADSPASWRVGDKLAIAPSGFSANESEQVTITGISGNVVSFTPALAYAHWGTMQTYGGRQVDQRAEVGLLTRDIVIRGDSTSDTNQFGGHVMIAHGCFARVQGVEFHKMGQMRKPGRYPFHWHLTGDGTGQWIKNCSVHDSFHRGILTHGIDNAVVENNVTYNIWSHHYVPSEDGVEVNNTFRNNLGIFLKGLPAADFAFPDHKQVGNQAEERPAIFWMRRSNQIFDGNHAAGVRKEGVFGGFGFFFDWANRGGVQPNAELTLFKNNVAHTIEGNNVRDFAYQPGHSGAGFFFTAYRPVPYVPQVMEDSLAYKCAAHGYWFTEPAHVLLNSIAADSPSGAFASLGSFESCLFVGSTANTIGGQPLGGGEENVHSGIFVPRKNEREKVITVRNCTFVNWRNEGIMWCERFASLGAFFENNTMINCAGTIRFFNDYDSTSFYAEPTGYLLDVDGKLSGTNVPTAIFSDGQGFNNANSVFNSAKNYYHHRLVDLPAITVDNSAAVLTGSWVTRTTPAGFLGSNYLSDNNTNKGALTAQYNTTPASRTWFRTEVLYPIDSTLETSVPVDHLINDAPEAFYALNQSTGGGAWRRLGWLRAEASQKASVRIGNAGTTKAVAADAVRFIPLVRQ